MIQIEILVHKGQEEEAMNQAIRALIEGMEVPLLGILTYIAEEEDEDVPAK